MLSELLLEKNLVPDFIIRSKIRSYIKLREESEKNFDIKKFIDSLSGQPIAVDTKKANEQHYEVPARFFELTLGPQLKYSCALFEEGAETLAEAESKMLELTAKRAQLADGQTILELGCGWGSFSLWMAQAFPNSEIISVSNSHSQKKYIDSVIARKGFKNLKVMTADMNQFDIDKKFDRIVSVEMFEHMRNIQKLFAKVASFLKPEGLLFIHIFSHTQFAYLFEVRDQTDWMAKYFFTGGMMPSDSLYSHFQEDLIIETQWIVNGVNYSKTAEAWLQNMDSYKKEIKEIFSETYGDQNATKWWVYWRIFFMSCSELWRYKNGKEWHVMHYLLRKKDKT
jgi:cyclopropane-fatty-acyl-phospholipid synthase